MFLARTALVSFLLVGTSNAFAPMRPSSGMATFLRAEGDAAPAEPAAEESKVDVSIPYDATVELAYEQSDKSMSYEEFKPQYLANAVAEVTAKQSGGQAAPADEVEEEVKEEEAPVESSGFYKRPTLTQDQIYGRSLGGAKKDVATEAKVEAKVEEATAVDEDRPKKRGEGVTYYKRPTLTEKQIYAWSVKTPTELKENAEKKKEKEGKFTLKRNEEKAEYVKNLDRSKPKPKPVKKKKKTSAEKKEIRKTNIAARTGKFTLKNTEKKALLVKEKIAAKPKVEPKKKTAKKPVKKVEAKKTTTVKKTTDTKSKKKSGGGWFNKNKKDKVKKEEAKNEEPIKEEAKKEEPKEETTTVATEKKEETFKEQVTKQQTSIEDVKRRTAALLENPSDETVETMTTAAAEPKKETPKGGFFGNLFKKKEAATSDTKSSSKSIEDIKKETAALLEEASKK